VLLFLKCFLYSWSYFSSRLRYYHKSSKKYPWRLCNNSYECT